MEECEALRAANIAFRVVPGVSAAVAAPAAAGISVTHREHSSAFVVVAGEQSPSAPPVDWGAVARIPTIIVLMGLGQLATILARLVELGLAPDTPAAMISDATLARERVAKGTVSTLPRAVAAAGILSPATLIIGDVVRAQAVAADSEEYSLVHAGGVP
jgi:siroheme synthase